MASHKSAEVSVHFCSVEVGKQRLFQTQWLWLHIDLCYDIRIQYAVYYSYNNNYSTEFSIKEDSITGSYFCLSHRHLTDMSMVSTFTPEKSSYSSISIAKISYIQANTHTIWGVTPRFSGEPGSCGSGECFGDANPSIPLCMGGEQTLTGVILSGCGVLTSWGSIC